MRTTFLACAFIAAFAGWSQAATVANPLTLPTKTNATKKSPPRGLSDATIEQLIRAKLAKSKIGADKFTVKVQGGVAYWEGKTDVIQHKGAATRMAKTAGAVAVVNKIQISEAARLKAAHNFTGTVPRAAVKRADSSAPPAAK
jgi:osmotically-inducible protein OsmY